MCDFAEKVVDVVGLCKNPLENIVVLSVNEKTQILVLDWTRPQLPLRPGKIERRPHGDKRHGTANLYAAFGIRHRQRHGTRHEAPSGKGIPGLHASDGEGGRSGAGPARHPGQQIHVQDRREPGLSGRTPAHQIARHPNQRLVAERTRWSAGMASLEHMALYRRRLGTGAVGCHSPAHRCA